MSDNPRSATDVSEELKEKLISISYATVPIQSNQKTQQETNQIFTKNVKQHLAPEFQYNLNGYILSREQYIEKFCDAIFTEISFYDQKFTRLGNTIIMQGLTGFTCVHAGEKTERSNDVFYDIFSKIDDQWVMLLTYSYTQPNWDVTAPKEI
ncbi:MAG: hypothetical protein L3J39_05085 [Verrucomicrobiales bacterium]|nr:hypothetical protein [Verrucomicrobiales bacterium]